MQAERAAALSARDVVERGAIVLREGDRLDSLVQIVDGEVAIVRGGRLVAIRRAPAILELATAVGERPSSASYRAEGRVTLERVPRATVLARGDLAQLLAAEVAALEDARFESVVVGDDFFDPQPGALLVPGPYRFGPFRAHFAVIDAPAGHTESLLAPGLRPLPGSRGRMLLAFTQIENARVDHAAARSTYRYSEATPFIPCVGPFGRPGLYTPELYPDSQMAVLLGREIYGFPKRLARTQVYADGADVIVADERALRIRWSGPSEISGAELATRLSHALLPGVFELPGAKWLQSRAMGMLPAELPAALRTTSVFVRKRIASEAADTVPSFRIDELVEVPFSTESFDGGTAWDAWSVDFAPDHRVLRGRATAMFSGRLAFRFGKGIVRKRY